MDCKEALTTRAWSIWHLRISAVYGVITCAPWSVWKGRLTRGSDLMTLAYERELDMIESKSGGHHWEQGFGMCKSRAEKGDAGR